MSARADATSASQVGSDGPPRNVTHPHWAGPEADDVARTNAAHTYSQVPLDDNDGDELQSMAPVVSTQVHTSEAPSTPLQEYVAAKSFQASVALLIIFNAIVIGLETDKPFGDSAFWESVENVLLLCFSAELILRLIAFGCSGFFAWSGADFVWNLFDFVLISIGLFDYVCAFVLHMGAAGSWATIFRMFRLLRILRVFRLIRFLKQLYVLTYGFALASMAIFWVSILMTVVLYICAVVLVRTIGCLPNDDPDQAFLHEEYGSILSALLTLFQLLVQPALENYETMLTSKPVLAIFLVIFVIFGSFGMIALLAGVITEAMFEKNVLRLHEEQLERNTRRKLITVQCAALFNEIPTNADGEATRTDIVELFPQVADILEGLKIHFSRADLLQMLNLMDTDGSGTINKNEFCRGILHLAERSEEMQSILLLELQQDSISFVKTSLERLESSVRDLEQSHSDLLVRLGVLNGTQSVLETLPSTPPSVVSSPGPRTRRGSPGFWPELPAAARDARPAELPTAAWVARPAEPKKVQALADAFATIEQKVCALQGDMFSVSARLEETVSDARSQTINSQLGELAVRRRCVELESATADRLFASEVASRAAQRISEETSAQVVALSAQFQAMIRKLEERKAR